MTIYGGDFAEVYSKHGYAEFSARVAQRLPQVLAKLNVRPRRVLDLACGEGTFAVGMAKKGYQLTGADRSPWMLNVARRNSRLAQVSVRFIETDLRSLSFREEFDLVTSWYDSLNYFLRMDDLEQVFAGAFRALRPGGLFLFDMNTCQTLAKGWQKHPSFVEVDAQDAFVVHRSTWNARKRVATLRVTAFVRRDNRWRRVDELHRERGYSLLQIRGALRKVGFKELACWGSFRELTPPRRGTRKYWFAVRR